MGINRGTITERMSARNTVFRATLAAAMLLLAGAPTAFAQSSGDGAGAGICTWFTPAEIAKYLGVEVEPGKVGGPLNSLCQWAGAADRSTFLQIQLSSPRSWAVPDLADGFKRVKGIGNAAYIVPQFGGWQAAAKTPTKVVAVFGRGGKLTADKTLALLRKAIDHQ